MTLKLFHAPGSCSLAALLALEEVGADYEVVRMDLRAADQQRPEYLALNPKGRVPALATEQGVLTENIAILGWIAQTWPEKALAPADPFGFAQAQAFNGYLASTVHVAYAHRWRPYRWADEAACRQHLQDLAPEKFAATLQPIEDGMLAGPWVMGETFTTCDLYLFVFTDWLEGVGIDPARFPRLHDHRERVRARPSLGKVLAQHTG
jgi:glutathione S-transferase